MDLPIARINQSDVTLKGGSITIKSAGFSNSLLDMVLNSELMLGEYHALVRDNNHKWVLLHLKSTYEFDTLNVTTMTNRLNDCLGLVNYRLVTIGLLYCKSNGDLYIGFNKLNLTDNGYEMC